MNEYGKIVVEEWLKTAQIRKEIELVGHIVMPNHFHAIVFINGDAGERPLAPTPDVKGIQPRSIGALVAGFKSSVTRRTNEARKSPGDPVWQRNYHEHIIRNEEQLNKIRDYVEANPACWAEDEENPEKDWV